MSKTCTQKQAGDRLAKREEFTASALAAKWEESPEFIGLGRMDSEEANRFRAFATGKESVYVVYSYATPIAWADSSGNIEHTNARYSVTTSKQQGIVKRYL
jgi:hypothetical protein